MTTSTTEDFFWQKDGGEQNLNKNNKHLIFSPVAVSDAGVYECHISGKRTNGEQAMIRLIVRGNKSLRGVEWVHGLFLFPLVLHKM